MPAKRTVTVLESGNDEMTIPAVPLRRPNFGRSTASCSFGSDSGIGRQSLIVVVLVVAVAEIELEVVLERVAADELVDHLLALV